MFIAAAVAILIVMGMALIRAILGPTFYDRVLAVNMFGTKTVLLIAVVAVLTEQGYFLDIAIVYALINYINVIAILRYFSAREST